MTCHIAAPKWTSLLWLGLALTSSSVFGAPQGKVLRVGWGKEFLLPSIAAQFAQDGDTVEIDVGIYTKDAAVWKQNNLTIRTINGRAHLKANGAHAEGKAIWVIKGDNVSIENIEFSGAKVPDGNGAGIRIEGANPTILNCYFHDNENGVLSGANPNSDIVIEHSEFARNGSGTGQTHNLYIGAVRSFTLRYSYTHHARVGHNVKSRAARNFILYNRIMDEATGNSSYAIDLSSGGLSFIIGNEIQQGPFTENYTLVSYGAEGLAKAANNSLYFVNNTLVNERPQGGRFIFVKPGAGPVRILNNLFIGKGAIEAPDAEMAGNVLGTPQDVVSSKNYDYRLRAGGKSINAGSELGNAHGVSLRANKEYLHKTSHTPRRMAGAPDAGAHEFAP